MAKQEEKLDQVCESIINKSPRSKLRGITGSVVLSRRSKLRGIEPIEIKSAMKDQEHGHYKAYLDI